MGPSHWEREKWKSVTTYRQGDALFRGEGVCEGSDQMVCEYAERFSPLELSEAGVSACAFQAMTDAMRPTLD